MNIFNVWQCDFLLFIVWFVVGVYLVWYQVLLFLMQKIYFLNYMSYIDMFVIFVVLLCNVCVVVWLVVVCDYWDSSDLKCYIVQKLLNVVLIDCYCEFGGDLFDLVCDVLWQGYLIIIFLEGMCGVDVLLQLFKSGLFYFVIEFLDVVFVFVYFENLQCIMLKGVIWFVLLICKVYFGVNEVFGVQEDKLMFFVCMCDVVIVFVLLQWFVG